MRHARTPITQRFGWQARLRRCGFTLVEMLAVCVILALTATLSIGAASGVRGAHERLAAGSAIDSALRRGRLAARSDLWNGRPVALRVGDRLEVGPDPRAGGEDIDRAARSAPASLFALMPRGWSAEIVWAGEARLRSEAGELAALRFDADGRCADAGILAKSLRGDMVLVEIAGLSGQTRTFTADAASERLALRENAP